MIQTKIFSAFDVEVLEAELNAWLAEHNSFINNYDKIIDIKLTRTYNGDDYIATAMIIYEVNDK